MKTKLERMIEDSNNIPQVFGRAKRKANQNFTVFAHDLRTKDETSEFQIKAKTEAEALQYFLEDFPQKYWHVQSVELA